MDANIKKVLEKIRVYNELENQEVNEFKWTPTDLVLREMLNNGGGSSKGFLGIMPKTCKKLYDYIVDNKQEFINLNWVNKDGYNNFGFPLWKDYDF